MTQSRSTGLGGSTSIAHPERGATESVAAVVANRSFRDLDVYQRLVQLHLEVHRLSLEFPAFERFELGAQMRRSSNSAPANVAEGWGNDHYRLYLLGIYRAGGEIQETQHHLDVAFRKSYIQEDCFHDLSDRYEECRRMLRGLARRLKETNE